MEYYQQAYTGSRLIRSGSLQKGKTGAHNAEESNVCSIILPFIVSEYGI